MGLNMTQEITEQQAEEMYDEMIDECYGEVNVGVTFWASRVLKELDPIAYRCGFNDWMDSLLEDGYTLSETLEETDYYTKWARANGATQSLREKMA